MLACAARPGVPSSTRSYLHARLVGAHGLAFSTGLVRGAGQTSLALPLVALAGPEQRPLEGDVGLIVILIASDHHESI